MKYSPANAQSIGSRTEQQDAFGFSDPLNSSLVAHGGIVAVVADGMGGLAHGSAASQTAVRAFLDAYQSKDVSEDISDALLRAIETANDAVVSLAHDVDARNNLGTTLAAAVMHEESLYWVSAGDSRVYLFRRGQLTCLTMDHIYAVELDEKVEKGEITQPAASSHPERASLTSFLGLDKLPKIERSLRPFPLQPGDCAIICSDGLYRVLSDEEMAAVLSKDSANLCENLVQQAVKKGNPIQDNITVLALRCRENGKGLIFSGKHKRLALILIAIVVIAAVTAGAYVGRFHPFKLNTVQQAQGAKTAVVPVAIGSGGTPPVTGANSSTNGDQGSRPSGFKWHVKDAASVTVQGPGLNKSFQGPDGTLPFNPHQVNTYTLKPVFSKANSSGLLHAELSITLTPSAETPLSSKAAKKSTPGSSRPRSLSTE